MKTAHKKERPKAAVKAAAKKGVAQMAGAEDAVEGDKKKLNQLLHGEPERATDAGAWLGKTDDPQEKSGDKIASAITKDEAPPDKAEGDSQSASEETTPLTAAIRAPPNTTAIRAPPGAVALNAPHDELAPAISGAPGAHDEPMQKPSAGMVAPPAAIGIFARRAPELAALAPERHGTPIIPRVADQNGSQPNTDALASPPAMMANFNDVSVAADEEAEFDKFSMEDFSTVAAGQSTVMMERRAIAPVPDGPIPRRLADQVRRPTGTGQTLPTKLWRKMEIRLGYDLGLVRLYHGAEAKQVTTELGARAFADGKAIWLGDAADIANDFILAHETTHVIQQGAVPRLKRPANQNRAPPIRAHVATNKAQLPRAPPIDSFAPTTPHRQNTPITTPAYRPMLRRLADSGGDDGLLARGAERLANNFDSYSMLKVLIGRTLFTGQRVSQDATSYVGAFMKFIGQEETFEQMKQSGRLERGFQTIRDGVERHNLTWARVESIFNRAYDDFEWTSPITSLRRIFGPFFSDVLDSGLLVLKTIAELVAEAFAIGFGPRGAEVWAKIKAIGESIDLIIADPLGFVRNLFRAVTEGVGQFGRNVLTYIKKGLLAWVLGPLVKMGIELPETLDFKGIVSVILQVLGLGCVLIN